MSHVKKQVPLFVYFISNEYVLKHPTFLLVHNISIWFFLNIKFYKIVSVETQAYNIQWATETELTSEVLTKVSQDWGYFLWNTLRNTANFKQAAISLPCQRVIFNKLIIVCCPSLLLSMTFKQIPIHNKGQGRINLWLRKLPYTEYSIYFSCRFLEAKTLVRE